MNFNFFKKEEGKHYALKSKKDGKCHTTQKILAFVLTGFLVAVPFTASAQTDPSDLQKTAMDIAKNYNLIVFGDFACAGSDTEGAVAIGGNIKLTDGFTFAKNCVSPQYGLTVGGTTLDAKSGSVGGRVAAKENFSYSNININELDKCRDNEFNKILDFAALESGLQAESKNLKDLKPNGTVTNNSGSLELQGKSGSAANVFLINKFADLQSLANNQISIKDVDADSTVVINVAGKDVSAFGNASIFLNGPDAQHQQAQRKIIWNFYEAQTLTKSGTMSIAGSVLAPYATFKASSGASGNYEGTLIVKAVKDEVGIEGHNYPFSGKLPQPPSSSSSTKNSSSNSSSSSSLNSVSGKPSSSTEIVSIPDQSVPLASAPIASIPDGSAPLAGPPTGDFDHYMIFIIAGSFAAATLRIAFKVRKNAKKN